MVRFFALFAVIACFSFSSYFSTVDAGFGAKCIGMNCIISASASIVSILTGVMLIVVIVKVPRLATFNTQAPAGLLRRFASFMLDFFVLLTVFTPIASVIMVLVEYYHTGNFSWTFRRDYLRDSDYWFIALSILFYFVYVAYYFYYYASKCKPTLGQLIFGFNVVAIEGEMTSTMAIKRVILSILGVSLFPISALYGLVNDRVFWWDSGSDSIAVLTTSSNL
ncbi:RDD family protein [Vibrio sp. WXL210]|uniref:RDD family protein n=1 Tax=Vibrio sp. WXL210 TaxID=3450709 RepID=UPI003EC80E9D